MVYILIDNLFYEPVVEPRPPKLKGVAAGALVLGVLNENAGAAVLLAVVAAGALKENPELPDVGPPNVNPDIFFE